MPHDAAIRYLEGRIEDLKERIKYHAKAMETHRIYFATDENHHNMYVAELKKFKEAIDALSIRSPQQ